MVKQKFIPGFWAEIKLIMEVFVPSQILLRYLLVFSGHLLQPLVCVYAIYLEKQGKANDFSCSIFPGYVHTPETVPFPSHLPSLTFPGRPFCHPGHMP